MMTPCSSAFCGTAVRPLVRRKRACTIAKSSVSSAQTETMSVGTERRSGLRRTFERIAYRRADDFGNFFVSRLRWMETVHADKGEIELRMQIDESRPLLRGHLLEHRIVLPHVLRRGATRT